METGGSSKEKGKKSLILRTLKQYRSHGHRRSSPASSKATSWPASDVMHWVAPEGYFFVYVGVGKKRFMIKTSCVNHPLFKLLLDQAEKEYGFSREGPLELPCEVDRFHRMLREMEQEAVDAPWCSVIASTCTRGQVGYGSLHRFSHML